MKYLILFFITFNVFACDWSTIKKVNSGYLYSKECHIQVGKNIEQLEHNKKKIDLLNERIDLKDLALKTSDERVKLWSTTSIELQNTLNSYDTLSTWKSWAYFIGGMVLMGTATYLATKTLK